MRAKVLHKMSGGSVTGWSPIFGSVVSEAVLDAVTVPRPSKIDA